MAIEIAFVDDEVTLHKIFDLKFRKEISGGRYIFHHFMDGSECYDFFKLNSNSTNIKILFSDITMPKMDGFTLVKKLRSEYPDLIIYMASALDLEEYNKRAKDIGNLKLFSKPFDFEEMKDEIENVIQKLGL
ncbi:MAG: response regulator [Halobacteriovoraceae bacterium]|nr:response regulator [Halobacteriovoraceae bacterium]